MTLKSYGVEKYYEELANSSLHLKRFMRYHVPKEQEYKTGLVAHADKTFLSILDTNHVKGLEVMTRDGEWIIYEPSPSAFVVVAGEAFTAYTNGKVYSPIHRVISEGNEERHSIGWFTFVLGMLQTPPELIDDENPLQFRTFDNLEFLKYCKQNRRALHAIQEFCGV